MILCSTYNDPDARLIDYLENATTVVLQHFEKWVIRVTLHTHQSVLKKLRSLPLVVVDSTEKIISENSIENDHVLALKYGLSTAIKTGASAIECIDADRVIMATQFYPKDFQQMVEDVAANISKYEFINVRRSLSDLNSHHRPLVYTESEINRLSTLVFGLPLDVGSTADVMTISVAQKIVDTISLYESVSFPFPLYLIIAKRMGAVIGSLETNNILSFETPLQYRREVESQVGEMKEYSELQKAYSRTLGTVGEYSTTSVSEWERRFAIEKEYLNTLLTHLDICAHDADKKDQLRIEINASLSQLESQRKRVLANDFSI